MSEPRKAVSYRRVSTNKQAKVGQSLESQQQLIVEQCKLRGMDLIGQEEDTGSARRGKDRPGLDRAIDAVCDVKGVLVVYSLSRLARSTIDACRILSRIQDGGGDLVVVNMQMDTTTAQGKLLFAVFSAIAEFESNMIGERVKAAHNHSLQKNGYRTQGVSPSGYTVVNGQRVDAPAEQQIISRVMAVNVGRNYAETARELNSLGVQTIRMVRGQVKRDKPNWSGTTVRAIVMRDRGEAPYGTSRA